MAFDEGKVLREVSELRTALKKAAAKLGEQQEHIERLNTAPFVCGVVVAKNDKLSIEELRKLLLRPKQKVEILYEQSGHAGELAWPVAHVDHKLIRMRYKDDDSDLFEIAKHGTTYRIPGVISAATAIIVVEGKYLEVPLPTDFSVLVGDTVRLNPETMAIIAVSPTKLGGEVCYVEQVEFGYCEVNYEGTTRTVFIGDSITPTKGDRVLVDQSASVIIKNMGKEDRRYAFTTGTNVTWDQIGGLEEAKMVLREIVELPFTHESLFHHYKKRRTKGVLLYGPPGCGKTMLGQATATAVHQMCQQGGKSQSAFLYVKGPEILDKYVGVTEATIRAIFQHARAFQEQHGYPAVIFIDEADAVLSRRGSGISSDIDRTIVAMFLTEMDGLEASGAFILLATNRPDMLDPAVVREGRVDRKLRITRPTKDSALDILKLGFTGTPFEKGYTIAQASDLACKEVFNDKRVLYKIVLKTQEQLHFRLANIVSGGLLVNVAEQATSLAFRRNLKTNTMGGVTAADITAAVDLIEHQNRDVSHVDELAEFTYEFKDSVTDIKKVKP